MLTKEIIYFLIWILLTILVLSPLSIKYKYRKRDIIIYCVIFWIILVSIYFLYWKIFLLYAISKLSSFWIISEIWAEIWVQESKESLFFNNKIYRVLWTSLYLGWFYGYIYFILFSKIKFILTRKLIFRGK